MMNNRQFLKDFLQGKQPHCIIHINGESGKVISRTQVDGLNDDSIIAHHYSGVTPAASESEVDLRQIF